MRVKYVFLTLASAAALLALTDHLWERSLVIAQPLPETLEGHIPMVSQQSPVTQMYPVELEGSVVAAQTLTVRAPIDGVVQYLHEATDETVEADAQLAVVESVELTLKRLDNDSKLAELRATLQLYAQNSSPDLRKLQATVEGGKQRYRYAESSFQKVQELFQRGLVSGKEHADARVQLEADRLALAAAEREFADARSLGPAHHLKVYNQLQAAQLERDQLAKAQANLTIRAPFAGHLRRYAPAITHDSSVWRVGDSIKAGEALFYLESTSRLVKVDVSPAMLAHFRPGDSVQVHSKGEASLAVQGIVQDIIRAPYDSGTSASGESVAQVRIALSDPTFDLAGIRKVMVSKALPQLGMPVPAGAVLNEGGERFVYVRPCAEFAAQYTRRRVVVSVEQAGMALITGGLLEGECIALVAEGTPWGR
ncbi:efflux RND transporter periplasmic adaptor subunit [Pseudomonas turukhanskensis]|uniref:RND efflux pump membrane fusion protein barrel-sandwich domain-containing protein n=1 Tax=Pseudomonas turukhanskensis TaxID=1806536 RepID=A0A9W6K9W8_9PSED|nr:HlyD family efflux transporter periplasmic adaptor subunit [Pseudomonas turukhanskensis]GLK91442.1 hypothetical protein GCM10017655_45060 [Pseudomonas turukhanskensis]